MSSHTPPSKAPGSASQFTVCKTSERTRPAFQLSVASDSSSSTYSEDSESDGNEESASPKSPSSKGESIAVKSLQGDLERALRLSDDSNNRVDDSPCSSASGSPEVVKGRPQMRTYGKPLSCSIKASVPAEPEFSPKIGGDAKISSNHENGRPRAHKPSLKPKTMVDCRPLRAISDPASNLVTQAKLDTFFSKAPKTGPPPPLRDSHTTSASKSIEPLVDEPEESNMMPTSRAKKSRLPYDPTTSSLITQEKIDTFFAQNQRSSRSQEQLEHQEESTEIVAIASSYGIDVTGGIVDDDNQEIELQDDVSEVISVAPPTTCGAVDLDAAPDVPGFSLPPALWHRLYPHQRTGVSWLHERYIGRDGVSSDGCLLGDAMGMGKTIQTCSLLAGLFRGGGARLALIVAPVSCLHAWREELERTFQGLQVTSVEEGSNPNGKRTQKKKKKKHVTDQWDNSGSSSSSSSSSSGSDDDEEISGSGGWLQRHSAHSAAASRQSCPSAVRVEELTSQLSASKRLDLLSSIAHDAGVAASRLKARSLNNKSGAAEPSKNHALGGCGGGCAVVLCSYGLLGAIKDVDEVERKMAPNGGRRGCSWDAIILDEGHKIKTHSAKVTQAIRALPAKWRLLLTGTPIQNNLKELWALYNFLALPTRPDGSGQLVSRASAQKPSSSSLSASGSASAWEDRHGVTCAANNNQNNEDESLSSLGDWPNFKQRFADPIERARHADANLAHQQVGRRRAALLRRIIGQFTLQRSKESLKPQSSVINAATATDTLAFGPQKGGNSSAAMIEDVSNSSSAGGAPLPASECPSLPAKHEVVLWVGLSKLQRYAYEQYLKGTAVQKALGSMSTGPLVAIGHLKKITSHAILAAKETTSTCNDNDSDSSNDEESANNGDFPVEAHRATVDWTKTKVVEGGSGKGGLQLDVGIPATVLLQGSHKLAVLVALVNDLARRGHKTLVFSQSVRMLHLIAHCLDHRQGLVECDLGVVRIDGSVGAPERASRVKAFNSTPCEPGNPRVMLLTTGVGALGLTLTGADRVIMYDPSWNPSEDTQAVDRAHRFGQTREVITYRMIGAGTVEEKVYEKQVFKDGLRRTLAADKKTDLNDGQDSRGPGSSKGNDNEEDGTEELSGKRQEAHRYFTREELRRVFELGPEGRSDAMTHLHSAHGTTQQWAARLSALNASSASGAFVSELSALEEIFSTKTSPSSSSSSVPSASSEAVADTTKLSELCASGGLLVGTSPHDALYTALAPGSAASTSAEEPLAEGLEFGGEESSASDSDIDDITKKKSRRHFRPHRKNHHQKSGRTSVDRNKPPRVDVGPSNEKRREQARRHRRRSSAVLVIDEDVGGASDGVILIEESDAEEEPWSGGGESFETGTLIDELSDEEEDFIGRDCSVDTGDDEIGEKVMRSEAEEVSDTNSEESGESEPSDGETLVDESRSCDDVDEEEPSAGNGDDEEDGSIANSDEDDSSVVVDLRGLTLSELAGDFAEDPDLSSKDASSNRPFIENESKILHNGCENDAHSDLVDTDDDEENTPIENEGGSTKLNRGRLRRPLSNSHSNPQSQTEFSLISQSHVKSDDSCKGAQLSPEHDNASAVAFTLAAATRQKAHQLTTAAALYEWQERQDRVAKWIREADELCHANTSSNDAAQTKEIRNLRTRALEECLEALEMADDDEALHRQIVSLVQDLGIDLN